MFIISRLSDSLDSLSMMCRGIIRYNYSRSVLASHVTPAFSHIAYRIPADDGTPADDGKPADEGSLSA